MADENIPEIVIADDAPLIEIDDTASVEKVKPTTDATDAVEQLKRQLAERTEGEKEARLEAERSRSAATEAERQAREYAGNAQQATKVAQSHELDSVNNALGSAQREMEALEGKLATAMEAGEFGTVAKLQGQIGKQGAMLVNLEQGKAILEQRAKEKPAQQQPRSPEEQREAYLRSRTPETAAWLRANPRFFTDAAFRQKVESADGYVANILGVSRDSPEYFQKIEETTGMRQAATSAAGVAVERSSDQQQVESPKMPTRPAPAAAPSRTVPASRSSENASGDRITLTRDEYDAAQWMFPRQKPDDPAPHVVYAKNKQALVQEGRVFGADGRPVGRQNN